MNPAEQAALAFCSTLFPDPDALVGYECTLLVLDQSERVRGVRWLSVDPAAIAPAVVEANTAGGAGAVYLSAALARPGTPHHKPDGRTRRMENSDIGALVGVWVDLDVAGPAHKTDKRLPPDLAAVRRILESAGLRPTMVVDSGHGVHGYWCFPEPLIFAEEPDPAAAFEHARVIARDWQRTLAVHAHRIGRWQIDATHDFARVLRVPGSTNRKLADEHRKVQVVSIDETARYELDDIAARLAEPELLAAFAGLPDVKPGDVIARDVLLAVWQMVNTREYRDRGYMPEWLAYALDSGTLSDTDRLVKVWKEGHESGDASNSDISLARLAANLELDERDAAEIIMCYRLRTNNKVEKVDPNRRADYLQRTIGKAFESYRKQKAERAAAMTAAADAIAAQERAAKAQRGTPPPEDPPLTPAALATDPVEAAVGTGKLGQVAVAALADRANVVTPTPEPVVTEEEASPPAADTSDPEPEPDEPPADEPEPDEPPADTPPPPPPPVDDPPAPPAADDPEPPPLRPVAAPSGNSVWGTRPPHKAAELDALSQTLLGDLFPAVRIWRLFTRGRGARAERFPQLRFDRDFAWADKPPIGYHPGVPFNTGAYPAASFNKLGGWIFALEVDALLRVQPITAEQFALRFGKSLVQMWEPDNTGGALANVVHDALQAYLMDFPPVPSMNDAVAQGMPVILQEDPRWLLSSPFTVLVRWSDFCRFVKGQYGVNVTPPLAAEMAELAGAQVAPTATQEGRWRSIRMDYFTEHQWATILHGAHIAEQQRDDRHSMRVMPGGRADDPAADGRPGSRGAQ